METHHHIRLGSVVIWKPEPGSPEQDCAPAIVTRTPTNGVVSVAVIAPESKIMIPKDSVRYTGDSEYHKYAHLSNGVWDYTAEAKTMMEVVAALSVEADDEPIE